MMAQDAVGLPAPLMQVCLSATLDPAIINFTLLRRILLGTDLPHKHVLLCSILPRCMDSTQCIQVHVYLIQVCLSATLSPATGPFSLHAVACLFYAGLPSAALCAKLWRPQLLVSLMPALPLYIQLPTSTCSHVYLSLIQAAFVFALLSIYWVVWLFVHVSSGITS